MCMWWAAQQQVVAFLDLLQRIRVVVRSNRNITTVHDLSPRVERVRRKWNVVATIEIEAAGTLSDTAGPEASTGAVGCASVKGRTNERNVELRVAGETWVVWKAAECGYAGKDGVGLFAAITRKCVIPQSLVGTIQRVLVVTMVAMRSDRSRKAQKRRSEPHLAGVSG